MLPLSATAFPLENLNPVLKAVAVKTFFTTAPSDLSALGL